MKSHLIIAAAAAFALAACGQSTATKTEEAPPAPVTPFDTIQAQAPEMQQVSAYQALAAYQAAHPEVVPPCTAVRDTASRGIVPTDVAADSIYAAHVGSAVYWVQCGALISRSRYDPAEAWLVAYAPGAAEPVIENCANPAGQNLCSREIPRTAAAPATPAPATP